MKVIRLHYLVLFIVVTLTGCAEMRNQHPAKVTHPSRPVTTPAVGQPQKVTSPTGVEREVVRIQGPQLAMSHTPQRLASIQIIERGKTELGRRELDKALKSFQEAIAVDGTNGIAYYYMAKTRYELHQYLEAMGLLERAESLLGDAPEWLNNVAELRTLVQAAAH